MPPPILPLASHMSRPTFVAGLPLAKADEMVKTVSEQEPLGEEDFAHLLSALKDPKKASKASAWIQGNNVSEPERQAFYDYIRENVKARVDGNIIGLGNGVGLAPEDLLGVGLVGKSVAAAVKAAPAGRGLAAGALQTAVESAPIAKYEVTHRALKAMGVPDLVATPLAIAVSGYRKGGAKAARVPEPTLSEQLGVSPTSTGAVMDSLPATAAPGAPRVALPLAHDSARTAAILDKARANAADLGVVSDATSQGMPLGVAAGNAKYPPGVDASASLQPSIRERIPVPLRTSASDATQTRTSSSFDELARELGVSPKGPEMAPDVPAQALPDATDAATGVSTHPADRFGGGIPGENAGADSLGEPLDAIHGPDSAVVPNGGSAVGLSGLSPEEKLREELAKELMSRDSFRNAAAGSRKRGIGYSKPKG